MIRFRCVVAALVAAAVVGCSGPNPTVGVTVPSLKSRLGDSKGAPSRK